MEEAIHCHHPLLIPDKENLKKNLKEQGKDFLGINTIFFVLFCINHFKLWAAGRYKHLLHTNLRGDLSIFLHKHCTLGNI